MTNRERCNYGTACRRRVAFHHVVRNDRGQTQEIRPVCAVDAPFLNGGTLEPVPAVPAGSRGARTFR